VIQKRSVVREFRHGDRGDPQKRDRGSQDRDAGGRRQGGAKHDGKDTDQQDREKHIGSFAREAIAGAPVAPIPVPSAPGLPGS
jgi:hypothetical protein